MKLLRQLVLIAFCVVGLALMEAWKEGQRQLEFEALGTPEVPSIPQMPSTDFSLLSQQQLQNGFVTSSASNTSYNTQYLANMVNRANTMRMFASFYLSETGLGQAEQRVVNYAATGINRKTYFANSFLVGYMPFKTKHVWVPLATLSTRKRYVLDHKQYGTGMNDIWQNSHQAYAQVHGDCEDHALILADWLIGLGYDAKVAIGEVPDGGHAWVLLSLNGQDYVLEATQKRKLFSVNDFKLARLATDYRPRFLFNRTQFWANTGSVFTTQYSGENWVLGSVFERSQRL